VLTGGMCSLLNGQAGASLAGRMIRAAKALNRARKPHNGPMVALRALLNVLPPPAISKKGQRASGAAGDFAVLDLVRRLAFAKDVPPPDLPEQFNLALE